MSDLENLTLAIAGLTKAVETMTAVVYSGQEAKAPEQPAPAQNAAYQPTQPMGNQPAATAAQPQNAALQNVQSAQQVPVQNAAVTPTQNVAAQNAAASLSNITIEDLSSRITAKYQASGGDTRIQQLVQQYGGAEGLRGVPQDQYAALIQQVEAL